MLGAIKIALVLFVLSATATDICSGQNAGGNLEAYVDELPILPKIYGYVKTNGLTKPGNLRIGMYQIKWKFHRDLPASPVFVYGTSPSTATFPGPVIEAIQGVATSVTWENHLPDRHILPWDPTVPTAIPKAKGVPAVVHLHGGVLDPTVDGSAFAWFTRDFKERGPKWTKSTYTYGNVQHPGNLWYHDHALGLTRENLLAGLLGPYVVRNPKIEDPFMLPSGSEFDRHLVIADRSFNTDGSIYMNKTGNVPTVHPQWRPEYFGDAMTVNGKAWPFSKVQKRKYRFRIINACNARYLQLRLSNGLPFTVIGSDTSYLSKPITTDTILMSPAEIYDVVVDFSTATTGSVVELTNSAPYPYPNGTPPSLPITKVMRFELLPPPAGQYKCPDGSKVPSTLINYPPPSVKEAKTKRYIVFFENVTSSGEPLNLHINGKTLEDPPTETPKSGSTEVWEVINLTGDNHPLHLHLAMFQPVKVQKLRDTTSFKSCMQRLNDAVECNIDDQVADGEILKIPDYEKTWKNVVKIEPDHMTTVVVKFNLVEGNAPYPFDATADPGFVYHCHILDHEDNSMIRPLILRA